MKILIAHDSGAKPGTAFFYGQSLTYVAAASTSIHLPSGARALIEIPESRGGRTNTPTDDLIKLALRAGEFGGYCHAAGASVEYVKPSRWKGTTPKKICHERVRAELSRAELSLLVGRSIDCWDAVGIGLWDLGRVPGP
jgi:hypothetical protein